MFFRIFREGDVRQFFDICIRYRYIETVADMTYIVYVYFFNLVRDVFIFSRVVYVVIFNGMSKDYCRFVFGFLRFFECSVDFFRIVIITVQCLDLFVSLVCNQCCGFRIFIEEVFTNVRIIFRFEGLVVVVNGFVYQLDQFIVGIFTQQFILTVILYYFDYVLVSIFEDVFQFVDDFVVIGDRVVKTLQVIVDNEDQVIQFFTGSDGDRIFGFRFVYFIVIEERVNGLFRGIFQVTVFQIFQEFSLVNSINRIQIYRYGRELLEFRYQFRVRIGREVIVVNFLTEVIQLFLSQTIFQESTSVYVRGDVVLEVNQVVVILFVACTEEVVKVYIINGCGRLEGRYMVVQFEVFFRRTQYRYDGVLADS